MFRDFTHGNVKHADEHRLLKLYAVIVIVVMGCVSNRNSDLTFKSTYLVHKTAFGRFERFLKNSALESAFNGF